MQDDVPMSSAIGEMSRRRLLGMLAALGLWPVLGHAAAVPAGPRVVTLFQGATDTAVALGVIPVGVVESWQYKPIYPYLREALAGVTMLGLETQPSLEDVVLLEPDVIVASRFRHERIAPLLSSIAPVIMLEDIYRFKTTLAVMGRALNRERAAVRIVDNFETRVHALRNRLAAHFEAQWPLTVSLLDIRVGQVRSYLPTSFGGSVLWDLGFRWNEAQRDVSEVSLKLGGIESLPVVDAEVFFVMRHGHGAAVSAHYERLIRHPLWQRMVAPSQGRVVEIDAVAWSLSGGILGANRILDDVDRWLTMLERI